MDSGNVKTSRVELWEFMKKNGWNVDVCKILSRLKWSLTQILPTVPSVNQKNFLLKYINLNSCT